MRKSEERIAHEMSHILPNGRSFDYDRITDHVVVGTNMCCQIGFDEELLQKGIRADISLEDRRLDNPEGVESFLWLPTKDDYAPAAKLLRLGVLALDFYIREGVKVYVHCKNGHGRAPTLVMAYYIATGMTKAEAFAFVKSKRRGAHLSKRQHDALRRFERSGIRV